MTETEQVESPESTSEGTVTEAPVTEAAPEQEATPQEKVSVTEAEEQETAPEKTETPSSDVVEPEGAPETYEDFNTPEGVDSLDEDVLTTFSDTAKELNLSQDKAQSLVDAIAPKMQLRQKEVFKAQVQTWANETATDPEIGGDRLDESVSLARKAYRKGASPELQELLKTSGLDVHPEMVRMFRYFGSRLSEDKIVAGGEAPSAAVEGDVFTNPGVHMNRLYKKHLG